jgi:hypothetical protein
MATRRQLEHQDDVRKKIQASQLLNRLQDHIFNSLKMEASQIKAIEILLRKCLPDLSNVQVSGDENNPLNVISRIERTIVDPENKHS